MPIFRNPNQSDESLAAFYASERWQHGLELVATNMLSLISLINKNFLETELKATTSIHRLGIQPAAAALPGWVVIVEASVLGSFTIEYRLPNGKGPWPNALVKGEAKDVETAFHYLVKAMVETEVWTGNAEVERLSKTLLF